MCQNRSRGEQRNEGLRLLLLAGVLLLLSPAKHGPLLRRCDARLLEDPFDGRGRRGPDARLLELQPGRGGHTPRQLSPTRSPIPAPSPSPGSGEETHPRFSPTMGSVGVKSSSKGYRNVLWAFLIGPIAFVVVVALFVGAKVRLMVRKRKREGGTSWKKGISDCENDELEKISYAGVPSISPEELDAACEEFTNVISTAVDGKVFKGIRASDGMQIAVTRMEATPGSWTARKEISFRRKVEDLARMSHDNLVNLLAYSTSEEPFERMLVFEYASNGTLGEHLHGRAMDEDHLDWSMRMRIVMGAAYGLRYMHHDLHPPASHFKFDASHVLLTEDYAAKVADFGISDPVLQMKSLGRRKSFKKIVRAIGYTERDGRRHAPYFESNVRSFGVFLLETITGRTPYTESQGPLIEWAKEYLSRPEKMWNLVDPSLKEYKKEELEAVCEVVKLCIQPKANMFAGNVPSMKDVTEMLARALNMTPDSANNKGSPLLWAEMQLLASMDNSEEYEVHALTNSPRHRHLSSLDSNKGSTHPLWAELDLLSPGRKKVGGTTEGTVTSPHGTAMGIVKEGSPRPKLGKVPSSGKLNKDSDRSWADNTSELELLSPQDSSVEDPEWPLAASINSSATRKKNGSNSQESFGRSFRRVWAENSTVVSQHDLLSPGSVPKSDFVMR